MEMNEISYDEFRLLKKHLWFYRELATGKRLPSTPAQKHFLDVAFGIQKAESIHEKVYLKWRHNEGITDQPINKDFSNPFPNVWKI